MRSSLLNIPLFAADFDKLAGVTLNPERHTSPNAHAHSLAVARRASALALANGLDEEDAARLHDLGLVHDIGKIGGTTAASKSVELLPKYGLVEPSFVELVRYHDVNLPWHMSLGRGEPPTDKAWRKMASRVDMLRLALFMVADRVDCPGGHRANAALVWFLAEAERRGLVASSGLVLDVET